jgi:hypothetical protein
MVLQTKIFLICTLRRYTPQVQKKKTLLRRVTKALSNRKSSLQSPSKDDSTNNDSSRHFSDLPDESGMESDDDDDVFRSDSLRGVSELSQVGAMELFSKIPFPEPRRVVFLKSRNVD